LIENTGTVLLSSSLQEMLQPTETDEPSTSDRMTNWRRFVSERLQASTSSLYAEALAEMERHLLAMVIENTDNNQAKGARLLGITRGNLRKKLRAIGLASPAASDGNFESVEESNDE
jgi:two-component system nitrogen regulation response regulator GlnG